MDPKLLSKQFGTDPGTAFLELIRTAPRPIDAIEIKNDLVAAGAKRSDVDRQWKRLQPYLRLHPQVEKAGTRRYEWSAEPRASAESLAVLAGHTPARVPAWLRQALVDNIADSLAAAETSGDRARSSWTHQREQEKAQLLAEVATAVETIGAGGGTVADAVAWLAGETDRRRLRPAAGAGGPVAYDPDRHDAGAARPHRGAPVTVIHPGYVWHGGDGPVVLVKAAVTP